MQKTLQDLHKSHERNESENIPILVEERWDAFQGIPKLRRLSLLEYLLGVHWASPSLSSFLSYSPHIETSSIFDHFIHTKLNRKLGKTRQYNKENHYSKYCSKPIHILFWHCSYCNITFPWLNPLIEIDSFIETSKLCIKNRICLKQDSLQ